MSNLSLTLRAKGKQATGFHPGLPQVNLLPPEVGEARALRHVKQWLAVSLVLVLAVVVLGYGFAVMNRASAESELADAQDSFAKIKDSEKQYAEVKPVLAGIQRATQVRTDAMSREVVWKQYLDAIATVLPADVSIDTFDVSIADATAAQPGDGLVEPGFAQISFTAQALTLPDDAAWIDGLNSIPGFYGASTSTATLGELDGVVAYAITTTVQVSDSTLSHRFTATTEGN